MERLFLKHTFEQFDCQSVICVCTEVINGGIVFDNVYK